MGYFHVAAGTSAKSSDIEPRLATVEALENAKDRQLFARWDYCFEWTSVRSTDGGHPEPSRTDTFVDMTGLR